MPLSSLAGESMKKLLAGSGAMVAGLVSSLLTAILIVLIESWTGIGIFTFKIWLVVPIGAFLCGMVSASGYYVGAKTFHQPATVLLLIQMAMIAALTQFLIYWLEYQTAAVDGVRLASVVPFQRYLAVTLTNASMVYNARDTGMAMGDWGYWFATVDFIGFLLGGASVFLFLGGAPKCRSCATYLRKVGKARKGRFGSYDDFFAYLDGVYQRPIDSPEFVARMQAQPQLAAGAGTLVVVDTTLYRCPRCHQQSILESVSMREGNEMQNVPEHSRFVLVPEGVDAAPAFAG